MYPTEEKHMKKNQWLKQFFYLRQYLPLSVKGNSWQLLSDSYGLTANLS